ncbi:MAG: aldo/keto reductase [Thermoguttaceae bacterium]|jgi:aryl-alcohol dehydrogenase-like predicted oxidoreductase|nr:aldo/keto reductase [Thermoguttaceae bacterium]
MAYSRSRRRFLHQCAAAASGAFLAPSLCLGKIGVERPMKRVLGRTGIEVTTLGLGGQASIQRTPDDLSPTAIIEKALAKGINYLDTSNRYGPSQLRFGEAFRAMRLSPALPGYDERRRRELFITSKSVIRYGKGSHPEVNCRTDGPEGSHTADDVRRALSQLFGDGNGGYPRGAYIDFFFIHTLDTPLEVDAIYEGLDAPDPKAERIGALATLRDYRDGTNLTGLNPREERLIRHIGISGHSSSPVLMECLERDEENLIDAMLVSINPNDRRYLNHQFNSIPVAAAKGVGIVGMKVFANGAMYHGKAEWPRSPDDIVRTVGSPELPSRALVEYALATPGVATAIIGIGHIDNDARRCQIEQNMSAAQVRPESLSEGDRAEIEGLAAKVKEGETNWFQLPQEPLSPPREATAVSAMRNGTPVARLSWQTAIAADHPIRHYEIARNGRRVAVVEHRPQTTKEPFTFEEPLNKEPQLEYTIATVDASGRRAASAPLRLPAG